MRSRNALVLLTLLAAVLAAAKPTRAAARLLANLHVTPDTVSWEAPAGLGELELAVTGPDGVVVRRQFAAGATPTFDLFDERGERRPDGVYTYELRGARELRPGRSLLLSGSLAIRDGGFVDPEVLGDRPSMGPRPIFKADTVVTDDLIVKGSTCLGFECADGTPGLELVVKSSSPDITFEDTGGGVSGTHDWMILINGAFGENAFKIWHVDSNAAFFYITGGGSVGIGTTAPSSKLHVNGGDIRVSGGSFIDDGTTLNVPDYVFEPSYELMPLEELREFVAQEKHLPNVPNVREVKEKGINLSQFQMRLLEKVEELTLYTLNQDERLTNQHEELLRLREQNALLHERLAALEKAVPSDGTE